MKRTLLLAIAAALLLIFTGCPGNRTIEEELSISVDRSISAAGGDVILTVASNTSWTLSSSESWLVPEVLTGKGDASVKLAVAENTGAGRSANVTAQSAEVTVVESVMQSQASFKVSPASIEFGEGGESHQITVSSPGKWSIKGTEEADWVTLSSTGGDAGGTITVTSKPVDVRTKRGPTDLLFSYGGYIDRVTLSQPMPNTAPSAPVLLSPTQGEVFADYAVTLSWSASADAEGDPVTYSVYTSDGSEAWTLRAAGITGTSYPVSLVSGAYRWKVTATDSMGDSSESQSMAFTVATDNYDGRIDIYQSSSVAGALPVNIVFIGDGYVAEDYEPGGTFEQHLQTSMDAVFAIEPYKTYRDYFKVTVITAYSQERGVTITNDFTSGARMKAQTKSSKFGCVCVGGNSTRIDVDGTAVQNYVKSMLGVSNLDTYSIFMAVNVDAWAGTCTQYSSGLSIARSAADYNLGKRTVHEGAGHGVGMLKDEYYTTGTTAPSDRKATIKSWRAGNPWSYAGNVDYENNKNAVHWKDYFTRPGYESVGYVEGGDTYNYGVWRSGEDNIMQGSSGVFYFNAPSREAIVRRIMKLAGTAFSIGDFLSKDVHTVQAAPAMQKTGYIGIIPEDTPPEEIDDAGVASR